MDSRARLIREHPRFERTPIIFVTGVHVSELDRLKGYEVGAIDYISVPLVPEILRGKVAVLVELYQRRATLQTLNQELQQARAELDARHAQALNASEQRLRALFEVSGLGMLLVGPDCTIFEANQSFCEIVGHSHEEIIGTSCLALTHADDFAECSALLAAMASGEPRSQSFEGRIVRKPGDAIRVRVNVGRLDDGTQEPRLLAVVERISHRVNAEQGLVDERVQHNRSSRLTSQMDTLQRLTAALASATTLQEIADFVIDQVRPALQAEIGVLAVLSNDGQALRNIGFKGVSQDTVEAWATYPMESPVPMAEAARSRKPVVVRTRKERNLRYPVLAETHGVEHGGAVVCFPLLARDELLGSVGYCFGSDRSFEPDELRFLQALADQCALALERARWYQRAQSEIHARRAAEHRLESVLESIDDHLVAYDREWRYVFVNAKAAKVLGRSREELLGRCIWELFPDAVGNQYYTDVHVALAEQRIIRSEVYYEPFGAWFENRIYPGAEGVTVFSTDITWRKKAEEALIEADRRKDDFLATLAHELRNPLAPILNCVRIAKIPNTTEAQKAWSLNVIERQAQHMSLLLDDLLDVSRITHGKLELKRQNVELSTVIDAAVETARLLVDARSHTLHIEAPVEPIFIFADAVRLAQVLSNLIKNAAQFTDRGGHIRLLAALSSSELRLSVTDTGVGIAPEVLPRLFQMFVQVPSNEDRAPGGMGIGLALARRLVELHGGRLDAQSDGIGRGSTFTVTLPVGLPHKSC